jgi:hypothetical protein
MSGHRRRRHALEQPEASGVNVEMAPDGMRRSGPQQLPIPDQVADRYRLNAERLGLAPTASAVLIALKLDKLGRRAIRRAIFSASSLVSRLSEMAMAFGRSLYT